MANITLPSNPVNGQTVVIGTRLFQYDSASGRWKSRVFQPLGDTTVTVTNQAPTITASLSEIALDTSGANVSFTYTVSDVDSSILKVDYSVSGIANSDLATVTHHKANNTVTITAGTEEFANGQITLTVTDGRNNATDTVDVSAAYGWDIEGATLTTTGPGMSGQDTAMYGLDFKSDGTEYYAIGGGNDGNLYQYNIATPWEVNTATYSNIAINPRTGFGTGSFNIQGVAFGLEGTKMYVTGWTGALRGVVTEWDLSTAWDITTAVYSRTTDLGGHIRLSYDLYVKPDGTKIYFSAEHIDRSNKRVFEYNLSTPWDISTMTHVRDIASWPAPNGLHFSSDGSRLFVADATNDVVYQYDLSTPWNISTVSYNNVSVSLSGIEAVVDSVRFKPDGTKMYIVGGVSRAVRQFDL